MLRFLTTALILAFPAAAAAQSFVPAAKYWLKRYPVRAFSSHWTLSLKVDDPAAAKEEAAAILRRNGGKPHLPVSAMAGSVKWGQQQLSFSIDLGGAEKAASGLENLGDLEKKKIIPVNLEPDLSEVRSKLSRIETERVAGKATIDRFGSIAALTDELIEHLHAVVRAGEISKNRVLLNVILEAR